MYIPPGFNTVTPYFFVADAEAFVRFLVQGLGGTETCRTLRPNGLIANVQVPDSAAQPSWSVKPRNATNPWLPPTICMSRTPMRPCNEPSNTGRRLRWKSAICRTGIGKAA